MKDILFQKNIRFAAAREFSHGNYDNIKDEVRIPIAIKISFEDEKLNIVIFDPASGNQLRNISFRRQEGDEIVISDVLLPCRF